MVESLLQDSVVVTNNSSHKLSDEVRGTDPTPCMYNISSCIIPDEYPRKFEYWLRFKWRKEAGVVLRPISTEAVFLCF